MAPSKRRERSLPGAIVQGTNSSSSSATNGMNGTATNNNNNNNNHLTNGSSTISPSSSASSVSIESQKLNGQQQEQELFLQAFEKPTQIYRFLRNRHGTSPIFLNRTLSYMKDRMSRSHKNRTKFKVDSILSKIRTSVPHNESKKYLNAVLLGIFYKSENGVNRRFNDGDAISVETSICKVIKNKRKDSTADYQEVFGSTSNVIWNPQGEINDLSTLTFPMETYLPSGDQHVIFKIVFRFKDNNCLDKGKENNDEGMPTQRKTMHKVFGCDLSIYDNKSGYVPMGDYEAALQELSASSVKSFSPKKRTWENLPDNYIPISKKFDLFNTFPTLKFRLSWSTTSIPPTISSSDLNSLVPTYDSFDKSNRKNGLVPLSDDYDSEINHNNNCIKSSVKAEKVQIVYNFVYSNNTRQQTEYTQEVICPWCGLDCLRLYALLKHLKLCHPRFIFTYQPVGNGARIDVTINDSYDGSYAGSPYDLAGPAGCTFARTCGPVRRTPVTNLLVCRPRRQKTSLTEFLVLDENELSNQRPYITGHNRLYHHTETCLPVHPKELDIDSEGESDPLWLRQKTIQMIDEFSDVNEGEKELMKLWNLHVMKHGFVGDCQLPLACDMFLDANGHEIIKKNLYRNFMLHMSNLFDYGLVSSDTVYKTVQKLQEILSKYYEGQAMMSKQRENQLKYWSEVGKFKQEELKLKSPQKQANSSLTNHDDTPGSSRDVLNSSQESIHNTSQNKRTSMKRSGNHSNNDNKLGNNPNKYPPKIAKKSATPVELMPVTSSKSRRSEPTAKRNSTGSLSTSTESLASSAKRRYSERDSGQQNASKRQRIENTSNGHVLTNGHVSSTKTRSSSKQNEDSSSKKIITRRRSVAGDALSQKTSNKISSNIEKQIKGHHHASSSSSLSSMRTRHSVPTRHDRR